MENQPFLDGPSAHSHKAKPASTNLAVRPHYIETPYSEVMEEPGPGLLLEYWDIVRRHKGTLVLIAFLGLLLALLFTLPQTPIYRARASLEIQNLNENFLNMRDVNPTTNEGVSSPAESDLADPGKDSPERIGPRRGHRKAEPRAKGLRGECPWPSLRVAQGSGSRRAPSRLNPRRTPAPGGQEPDDSD